MLSHRIQSEFVLFALLLFCKSIFRYPSCPDIFHFMWFLKGIVEILCIIFLSFFALYFAYLISSVIQFSRTKSVALSWRLVYITTSLSFCQPLFSFFLKFFSGFLKAYYMMCFKHTFLCVYQYITFYFFCQVFFAVIFNIFSL